MKKNKLLFFIVLILPYLEPLSFKNYVIIDKIYSAFKVLFFLIILAIYCSYIKKQKFKFSKFFIIIIMTQLELYFSTFINKGSYVNLFGQTISIFSSVMLIEMYIKENEIKEVLKAMSIILLIYSIINSIELLMTPKTGLKDQIYITFLGMDNRYIFYLLPLSVFSILYDILKFDKITIITYMIICLSIFQLMYTWSVVGMIAMLFLLLYILFINKIKLLRKIPLEFYLIIIVILNILFVFLQIQNYFKDFIVNVLHKNVMLSGRVYTWNFGIEIWKENMWFGIGGRTTEYLQSIYYGTNAHAHNLFLNTLVNGGIINLSLLFVTYAMISRKIKKCENDKFSSIINFSIFLILFLSLMDTFDIFLVYVIYELAYYSNTICKDQKKG